MTGSAGVGGAQQRRWVNVKVWGCGLIATADHRCFYGLVCQRASDITNFLLDHHFLIALVIEPRVPRSLLSTVRSARN